MSGEHPSGRALELVAVGDGEADATAHVAACDACRAYVTSLESGVASFATAHDANHFTEGVIARAERSEPAEVLRPFDRLLRARMLWAAAPLAAAAAILLLLKPGVVSDAGLGERARSGPEVTSTAPAAGSETFKGDFAIAVVRERGGRQERLAVGTVDVAPFDRLRLEVALDGPTPLAAGALGEDGSWVPLFAPTLLDGGTHFSEHSLRFDGSPSRAVVLVGDPAAIERARAGGYASAATAAGERVRVVTLRPAP